MKRSHAELLIAECLVEPHFPEDALKEAKCILDLLEKAGMLPPEYTQTDPGQFPGDNFSLVVREWEEE